ncbi:MAG: 3-hydroxyacyl-CoA dehydrogenase NAD-binding domain-containing protein, partial [Gammaproteobacteria bacterium]|nr:3-hydroxyacyl-CoA dehydrogenase NAD-binding domain-containing protein [Gammaproteobacteria bacterium]
SQPPKGLVIHSGKSNGFVMGADINEFTTIENPEQAYELIRLGQQVLDKLEALPCPTVAAINGFALGGGLELAMACDYRVALETGKRILGLPEVQLGIHPGFGGTVRAVQIAGVRPAMQLMLTGKPITAGKGRKLGLVDKITDTDGWRAAAQEMIAARPPKQKAPFAERVLNWPFVRPFIRNVLIKQVAGKARKEHYPAPYAIIELWYRHGASPQTGYEAEARSIAELMCTSTSRNLVRVFFLQNKLKGQGGKPAKKISHVHVVGAGVMGGDIAAWCALRGHTVTLQDREQKYIDPAMERAAKLFEKRIRDESKRAAASERLQSDVDGSGAARADLVIEAIFENLEAKQALYRSLQEKMPAGALLATNTSSIRLEDLREGLDAPQRFIGLHFFNPVAQLPLVEVIRCDDTEQDALDIGFGFVKGIGKLPLECRSSPGFVVNRILAPYMAEAMELAESGVPLAEIDRAAEAFGMPMGPVELVDSVGIDVALHVSKVLGAAMNRPVPEKLADMVEAGRLGRKSGEGFYRWENGKAVKPAARAPAASEDIQDRLILPMVNEAVACLHDGVVSDDDLLDAGVIFGTGFAPFRGGPVNYARERGVDAVLGRLNEFTQRYGERFTPHEGFSEL